MSNVWFLKCFFVVLGYEFFFHWWDISPVWIIMCCSIALGFANCLYKKFLAFMNYHVLFRSAGLGKLFISNFTLIRIITCMNYHMLFHSAGLCKLFVTNCALIRLFSCMDYHVCLYNLQTVYDSLYIFFSFMNSQVSCNLMAVSKLVMTNCTLIRIPTWLNYCFHSAGL